MKNFLRQNGIWLVVVALLLSLVISLGSVLLGGAADPLSNLVQTVTAPVRSGVSAVLDWAGGVSDYVLRYGQLQQELDDLRLQVSQLEEQVRQGEEASRENEQLRELLDLQQRRQDFVFENAKVTARSTVSWESTLTLSKGSSAGVAAGNCVITETGVLVGVVSAVGANWCTVSTVIDTNIEMGGIVTRTYSAGVLEGDFTLMGQGRLKLNYLPDEAQLVAGDEVLTSGKGDVYPSGLVVGRVEGVFTDPSGMTRYAVVIPNVDLSSLIEVFIIKDFDIVE